MLSICCGCLCGHCVFYPTEGSLVVLTYSWIFLLHFLPSENPLGILRNFFLAKLYVVQWWPKLHVVQSPSVFLPLHFSSTATNYFFSSSSSPLHILSNSSTSSFSLKKPLSSLSPFHNLTSPLSLFETLSLPRLPHLLHGTQVQEDLLCALKRCFQPYSLEQGSEVDGTPFANMPAERSSFGKCLGQIGEFFIFFLIFKFSSDLLF